MLWIYQWSICYDYEKNSEMTLVSDVVFDHIVFAIRI